MFAELKTCISLRFKVLDSNPIFTKYENYWQQSFYRFIAFKKWEANNMGTNLVNHPCFQPIQHLPIAPHHFVMLAASKASDGNIIQIAMFQVDAFLFIRYFELLKLFYQPTAASRSDVLINEYKMNFIFKMNQQLFFLIIRKPSLSSSDRNDL